MIPQWLRGSLFSKKKLVVILLTLSYIFSDLKVELYFNAQYVCHFTSYVSTEGTKTNTPELKQSGHPGSGDAENSSR